MGTEIGLSPNIRVFNYSVISSMLLTSFYASTNKAV